MCHACHVHSAVYVEPRLLRRADNCRGLAKSCNGIFYPIILLNVVQNTQATGIWLNIVISTYSRKDTS